jgi:hypothetical protein
MKSVGYWIIAIIAFPFLFALGEGIVELFRRIPPVAKVRTSIAEKTKDKAFSGLRIAYLLLEMLAFLGLIFGCWYLGKVIINGLFP